MRRARALDGFAVAILVLVFYAPLLRFGFIQSGGDAANLFWPVKILIQESLWQQHVIPLWNPYSFLGAPLAASLQHAVFYPPDWIIYGIFPAHIGLNVGNLFHLVIAGIGAWLWLRVGYRFERISSIFLGAAFPCCAWFWGQQEHINQVAAISWLPLQAFATLLYIQGRTRPASFVLVYTVLSALAFLTGHPQEAFYAQLFCGLLVLAKIIGGSFRGRIREVFMVGAGVGLITGLLVAVQLIMTLELQSHSRRQFRDPTYAISFSMPPDLLKTYFAPHLFGSFEDGYFATDAKGAPLLEADGSRAWDRRAYGEYGLYVGVPMLLLAVGAFASRRKKLAVAFSTMLVLFTLMALGSNTDPRRLAGGGFTEFPEPGWSLYEIFLKIFPPAQGFRVPARIIVLNAFLLVTLAAAGIEALTARLSSVSSQRSVAAFIGAAVMLSLYIPSRKEKFNFPVSMDLVLAELRDLKSMKISADERLFRLAMGDDDSLIAERHRQTTFAKGNPILNRMLAIQPHMNAAAHIVTIDGYEEGLVPTARMKDFLYEFNRNFRQAVPDVTLLTLLGVRPVYTELPIDSRIYPPAAKFHEPIQFENPFWHGAAFWLRDLKGIDFARLDGPWWRKAGGPLPEIQREAIPLPQLPGGWTGDRLTTTYPSLNSITVTAAGSAAPEDAVLATGWYPGWVIAGGAQKSRPVEFLSAVHAKLPADGAEGNGWALAFRPFSYKAGLFLSALGVGIWCGLLAFLRVQRRCRLTGEAAFR